MRVLICTNHFYPETFRCNDVAFELVRRGYDVTVLTAIPDYPPHGQGADPEAPLAVKGAVDHQLLAGLRVPGHADHLIILALEVPVTARFHSFGHK